MIMKLVLVSSIMLYLVLCPNGQSEQECNILQTLEALQNRLDNAETLIVEQGAELAKTKNSLTDAVTRLQEQGTELAETKSSLNNAVTRLQEQDNEITDMKASNLHDEGSTYIRWGRTSCPGNGSELVYTGYAGGSFWYDTGAAVDYLCLPTNPEYLHYEEGKQIGGRVYGAEYELHQRASDMAFFPNNDQTVNINEKDVPCAVCRTVRSSVLMVPARTTCHDGWTLEYTGYLSAGANDNNAASQYVCLDGQPEYLPGGAANQNGVLFYLVEGVCGSLRCPPYVGGWELTCAVCSI